MSQSNEKGFSIKGVRDVSNDEQNSLLRHLAQELGASRSKTNLNASEKWLPIAFHPETIVEPRRGVSTLESSTKVTRYILPAEWPASSSLKEFDAHLLDVLDGDKGKPPSHVTIRKCVTARVDPHNSDGTISVRSSTSNAKPGVHELLGFEAVEVANTSYTYLIRIPQADTSSASQCDQPQSQDSSQTYAFHLVLPIGKDARSIEETITSMLPVSPRSPTKKPERSSFYCDPATTMVRRQSDLGNMTTRALTGSHVLFLSADANTPFDLVDGWMKTRGLLVAHHRHADHATGGSAPGASRNILTVVTSVILSIPPSDTRAMADGSVVLSDEHGSSVSWYPNRTYKPCASFAIPTWTAAQAQMPTRTAAATTNQNTSPGQEKGVVSEALAELLRSSGEACGSGFSDK